MPNILVFAESRGGTVRNVVMELLTAAREKAAGGEVHAVLAGAPGIGAQAQRLAEFGAATVFVTEHVALGEYNAEALAALVSERVKQGGYRAVLFAASALLLNFSAHRSERRDDGGAGALRRGRLRGAAGDPAAPGESGDRREDRAAQDTPQCRFGFHWNFHDEPFVR